jgi:hypothetical protein
MIDPSGQVGGGRRTVGPVLAGRGVMTVMAMTALAGVPVAALAPVILLVVAFVAYCLWDLSRSTVRYLPKWVWALICLASIPVGGIVYLLVGREPR